jgi:hypothetical protein
LTCDGQGNCTGCTAASDCPGQDTECQVRVCSSGVCSTVNTPDGTSLSAQDPGDCLEAQCDGQGGVKKVPVASDPLDDGNECTEDRCESGEPKNPPLSAGVSCSQGGGLVCDANANCVECIDDSGCAPSENPCQVAACSGGVCVLLNLPEGTVTDNQDPGDCKENRCNDAGSEVAFADDSDLPVGTELEFVIMVIAVSCVNCYPLTIPHNIRAGSIKCKAWVPNE